MNDAEFFPLSQWIHDNLKVHEIQTLITEKKITAEEMGNFIMTTLNSLSASMASWNDKNYTASSSNEKKIAT